MSKAMAYGAEQGITLAMQHYPDQTTAVLDVLGAVNGAIDATVEYVDEKTGRVVSAHWNDLEPKLRDQIKGSGKVVAVFIPAGSVKALKQLKYAKQTGKIEEAIGKAGQEAGGSLYNTSWLRSEFFDAAGNPVKWRNPLTNKIEDVPNGVSFHKDHIFPRKEIKELQGFSDLSPGQQNAILNDPRNIQPLNGSMNCSKGCSIESGNGWPTYKDQPINAEYREWLKGEQNRMSLYFQDRITQMINGN